MNLPKAFRGLKKEYRFEEQSEGMSPAKVYRLIGKSDTLYLKVTDRQLSGTTYDVEREKDVLLWLNNKLPVPQVIDFTLDKTHAYLLMSAVIGQMCCDPKARRHPRQIVKTYAEGIKLLQSLNISNCPFDSTVESRLNELDYLLAAGYGDINRDNWEADNPFTDSDGLISFLQQNIPRQELCFSHGDFGGGNLFVEGSSLSGMLDWGRGGFADRWNDIALCIRSIKEFTDSNRYIELFFSYLDVAPKWDKIKYFILLDELF